MIITDFREKYLMYENMSIWEIKSMDEFFKAHENLYEIFEKEYGFPFNKINEQDGNFSDSEIVVVSKLLDHFDDKQFFVFSDNDKHHNDLKSLQDKKIVSFGMDIHVIHPKRIYVLEMDKTKDLKMYDS